MKSRRFNEAKKYFGVSCTLREGLMSLMNSSFVDKAIKSASKYL